MEKEIGHKCVPILGRMESRLQARYGHGSIGYRRRRLFPLVERQIWELDIDVHLVGPEWSTSMDLIIAASHFSTASDVPGLLQEEPWLAYTKPTQGPADA